VTLLVVGLALFLGAHLLPALPPVRRALVARWAEGGYKVRFSIVSGAGLALIVVGFANADRTIRLFPPSPAAISVAPFAVTVALILLAAANMRGHLRRIVRHPMLLGILIWATVHLFANGDLAGTLLFGSFLIFALVDLVSALLRNAVKTFLPEAKFDLIAVAAGIVAAFALMTFHRVLFGVAVARFGL
jgi:uncharacterized membrane protein